MTGKKLVYIWCCFSGLPGSSGFQIATPGRGMGGEERLPNELSHEGWRGEAEDFCPGTSMKTNFLHEWEFVNCCDTH